MSGGIRMQPKLLIKGSIDRILALLKALIVCDFPVTIQVDDSEQIRSAVLSSKMCHNLSIQIADKPELNNFDALLYLPDIEFYNPKLTDANQIAEDMRPEIDNLRDVINDCVSNGFRGKIVINAPHDEIFAYFAAGFSGLDNQNIIGVGTLPQEMLLKNELLRNFDVSADDINVNVLGLNTNNLVAWSRVYIGPATLLSYLADDSNNYSSDIIGQVQQVIDDPDVVTNQMIQSKALIRLLISMYEGQSLICSVVSVDKEKDELKLDMSPKLINRNGAAQAIRLQLSEDEQKKLNQDLGWANEIITAVINGGKDASKN